MDRRTVTTAVKLFITITLCIPLLPAIASADTPIPSVIDEDITWTEEGSPYVGGGALITSGTTVTVEPGVTVKLAGGLAVDGTLNVNGSSGNHVLFTSIEDTAPGQ